MNNTKLVLGGVGLALVAFLLGFGWQFTRARSFQNELATTRAELTWKRLEAKLAAATVESQRGNYELSRQLSSEFFTGLQNNLNTAPADKRTELNIISSHRDAIITAASRSDPQTPSLLGQLYGTYRVAFGEAPVTPQPAPATATPPTTTQ